MNENMSMGGLNPGEHKRRVRYKGTHPKHYSEKYKEHNPEKYADTIEKVISKGSTPAGMHLSIMVDEILEGLAIVPGEKGLDATLGYGGHSQAMMEQLKGEGHLYALDIDPIEIVKTKKRLEEKGFGEHILTVIQTNFCKLRDVAKEYGPFQFILADLGVSSMQIDNPERGFTYKYDGPLDLRLDPEHGMSAADRLLEMDEEELVGMFVENSDEPYAREIAKEINIRQKNNPIRTTTDLKDTIEKALMKVKELRNLSERERMEEVKKACARCFQAIRIDVNSEFEVLYTFLESLPDALDHGGRVAILTFHSGEDRLVKKAFKQGYKDGIYKEITEDVIRPGKEECVRNPRAKSTKLRFAVRA